MRFHLGTPNWTYLWCTVAVVSIMIAAFTAAAWGQERSRANWWADNAEWWRKEEAASHAQALKAVALGEKCADMLEKAKR